MAAAAQIPSPTEAGPLAEAEAVASEAGPPAAAVATLAGWPAGAWWYDKGSESEDRKLQDSSIIILLFRLQVLGTSYP